MKESKVITPGDALIPELLRQRAESYARQEKQMVTKGELREFLCLRLGADGYLIEACWIEEIVRMNRISKLPRQKDFFLGFLNVRGNLVPVADLATFLRLEKIGVGEYSRIVLIRDHQGLTGMVATEIVGYFTLDTGDVQAPGVTLQGLAGEYVKGLFYHLNQPFVWLDAGKILPELARRMRMSSH
jgi:purine-binding chemotaxis protein CheW